MSHIISRTIRAVALAGLVAAAAGCAATTAATQTTDSSSGAVLNVGDQQQRLQTLMQASGALAGASYKVNFVEFDSGPLVDAGFAAHRIDLGSMGDLPASLAVRSGLPVKAVAVDLPIGASEYLLAKPGITSISQLRGKPAAERTAGADRAADRAGPGHAADRADRDRLDQLQRPVQPGPPVRVARSHQRRGLMRREYEGTTLREHYGLARPPSRYASRNAGPVRAAAVG